MENTPITITIEARVLGQRRPLHLPWHLTLSPSPSQETQGSPQPSRLRDLLACIVQEEVRAFHQRKEERRLARVLGPREIADAAATGKIAMGGPDELRQGRDEQEIDEKMAISRAIEAFEDGLYFVFLDGQQLTELDAPVQLHSNSTLQFIRLVALAGG